MNRARVHLQPRVFTLLLEKRQKVTAWGQHSINGEESSECLMKGLCLQLQVQQCPESGRGARVVGPKGLLGQSLEVSGCEDSELIGSQLLNMVTPGLVGNSVPLSGSFPIQALPARCSE